MATKNLTYKIARINNSKTTETLQDLIDKAMQQKKSASSRKQSIDSKVILINNHGKHSGMLVAELINYTKGHKQPFAKVDTDAEELEISSLSPEDKSEFLQSILYFSIFRNSVILSQSISLRSRQLEDYINWILLETGTLEDGSFFTLSEHPPLEKGESIISAKSIVFDAPVSVVPESANKKGKENQTLYKLGSIGWDTLKGILPKEVRLPETVKASELVGTGDLKVSLKLSWERDRKDDSTAFMDRISNALRHVDDELDYTVFTRSGKITKNDVKLNKSVSVLEGKDGLLQRDDMWKKMLRWLEELINEKRIDPDA